MATALPPPCDESVTRGDARTGCWSETGTLVATILGSSLAFVVGSIINVALPSMQAEFGTDAAGVQWIVNAYLLPLAAFVLVGGALGDHYGRKMLFLLGVWVFTLATLACALAPSLEILLAIRFVQGVGAALIAPNSLAILADGFSGEARGKAIGTWAAAGAIAGAAAPVVGGYVVDTLDWRWAFVIVVPPAAAAALIGQRGIRETREAAGERAPLDLMGAALATGALGGLVYALIRLPAAGLGDPLALGALAAGAALAVAFLAVERRKREDAMMPLGIFGSSSFSGISILTLLLYGALGGLLVLLPYTLIQGMGYSATAAGAALLPFPAVMGLLSRSMGGWANRVGIRTVLTLGPLIVGVGFVLFAVLSGPGMTYWTGILPGLLVMALGMAISVAPLTTAVVNAVDAAYSGVAAGVNNAISRAAGLIATALLGVVLMGGEGALVGGFAAAAWVGALLALGSAVASFLMIQEHEVRA